MSTRGDELIDRRLDEAGGKGLFVKELENAMADGRADLAVHSMKDVPAELPPGFVLAAITAREDPRDAFVSRNNSLLSLKCRRAPPSAPRACGARRKSSSAIPAWRCACCAATSTRASRSSTAASTTPSCSPPPASSGSGSQARITARLGAEEMLPAPGQGALGIECLAARAEVIALLAPLADAATAACVRAERTVSRVLGGSCTLPLAAFADRWPESNAAIARTGGVSDGKRVIRSELEGEAADPEALGDRVAQDLRRQGADEILGL